MSQTLHIGIHDIALATSHHVVRLDDLAAFNGTDPNKYRLGLGQDEFSFPAQDEDIITMGAHAAQQVLDRQGTQGIRTLLFATESGVDQSKAAGVSVHRLLGLPGSVRVVEFKQACYSGTAALQAAIGIVSRNPAERVLVIMSDVAKYMLDSPGEPTQGAGAVAVLVSADPAILAIDAISGIYTDDVDDFWRPNDSTTAVVDGAISVSAYLDALAGAWNELQQQGGPGIDEIDRVLYHQPFTKMAKKAQEHLASITGAHLSLVLPTDQPETDCSLRDTGLADGTIYNRRLGNTYTASLYAGLVSLLDHDASLAGARIALFSYGSGSVSELLTGTVQPNYFVAEQAERMSQTLDARVPLDIDTYREMHDTVLASTTDYDTPRVTTGPFRFAGVTGQARRYERTL